MLKSLPGFPGRLFVFRILVLAQNKSFRDLYKQNGVSCPAISKLDKYRGLPDENR
jgi:hypothetical protein